jgi:hypothetical protein
MRKCYFWVENPKNEGAKAMREKLQRFMTGRYGTDQLSWVYLVITMILIVTSMFTHLGAFYWIALLLLCYTYYRMMSRNIPKMYAQNQKLLNMRYRIAAKWDAYKKRWAQRKEYHFYKCPSCKQRVRVPRGKGKICITCPRCKNDFVKKS